MALSPIMKRAIRRVADVLGAYAREHGWWPLDFRLYYRANEKWGKIDILFVSDGFDGLDEHEAYVSVMDHLGRWLSDEPELANAVGLVLQTFKETEEGGLYSIPRSYNPVRPRDLVVRALNEVSSLVVKYARDQAWADQDFNFFYRIDPTNQARLQIVVTAPEGVDSAGHGGYTLEGYIRSRLFDEPNILRTCELKVRTPLAQAEAGDLQKLGYKEFLPMPRSLIL